MCVSVCVLCVRCGVVGWCRWLSTGAWYDCSLLSLSHATGTGTSSKFGQVRYIHVGGESLRESVVLTHHFLVPFGKDVVLIAVTLFKRP